MSTIDDSREEFIQAFKAYAQAGNAMRDLLLRRESSPDDANLTQAVAEQQRRLNEMRSRYRSARDRYVHEILEVLGVSDGHPDSQPLLEVRSPDKEIH